MARPGASQYQDPEEEKLSAGDWALNVGSGAATGAATGAAFGPPGIVVGALVGGGLGALKSNQQNRELAAAAEQQAALDRELAKSQNVDAFQTEAALRAGADRQAASQEAGATAARLGLAPAGALSLRNSMVGQADQSAAYDRAQGLAAAASADRANRALTLEEYNTAQGLANNAMSGSERLDQATQALTQAAAYTAGMREKKVEPAPTGLPQLQPLTIGQNPSPYGEVDMSAGVAPELAQGARQGAPASQQNRAFSNPWQLTAAPPPQGGTATGGTFGGTPNSPPGALNGASLFSPSQLRDDAFLQQSGVDPALIRAARVLETGTPGSPEYMAAEELIYGRAE